ncbi:MAG: dTDP-4-dehydrorhamnose 3,5-epimerase family protein [Syntrophales bacterium]|nr:dTDP-4-dehydrorhamnose 3,5-epimerase family protein [Syntrophales bacterium]
MSRFKIFDLPIPGLKLIERIKLGDNRGFLSRLFCAEELSTAGWRKPIFQINLTYTSRKGTVRGLHFQHPPYAEMKMILCLRGKVWDVALDIRSSSLTFLKWHAEILSEENNRAILIPEGFAHGFQALTDDVELIYFHNAPYVPDAEDGISPCDPNLGITWPLPISELSSRDATLPTIERTFTGLVL